MSIINHSPAMYGAVLFHGAAMLPKLRAMTRDQINRVTDEAQNHSMGYPLHLAGPDRQFIVPSWSEDKLSGMQVVTIMVLGIFILQDENMELCAPLVDRWPIKEILLLCNGR